MGGEVVESDTSLVKADQARQNQVVEGSVGGVISAQATNWFEKDIPYEVLVGAIRQLIGQARDRHQQRRPDGPFDPKEPFEPAQWLGWYLNQQAFRDNDLREGHHPRYDLATAWDALYSTRYPAEGGEWGKYMRSLLETHVEETKQTSLTLPARSVVLLDAMAEAAGLPRKRGEATIDLTPFTHAADAPRSKQRENKSIPRRLLRK
jgi:hypothetical protein